jgi:hypothetical protein
MICCYVLKLDRTNTARTHTYKSVHPEIKAVMRDLCLNKVRTAIGGRRAKFWLPRPTRADPREALAKAKNYCLSLHSADSHINEAVTRTVLTQGHAQYCNEASGHCYALEQILMRGASAFTSCPRFLAAACFEQFSFVTCMHMLQPTQMPVPSSSGAQAVQSSHNNLHLIARSNSSQIPILCVGDGNIRCPRA